MLAKNFRLSKEGDFKQVFSRGQKIFGKVFIIRLLPNLANNSRICIIVSNKISKKATVRNKLKRQVKEVIRQYLPRFRDNFDIIITALPPSLELDYGQLAAEIIQGLQRSKII
ncbi:MAG: ribonuclease P protein component [Candidatus Buchananbacteria bacterium]